MKRIAFILTIMAMFAVTFLGCCPCRHLSTSVRDSVCVEVRERIIKIHDTVSVVLPAESEHVRTRDTTATAETSTARATASVCDGWLSLGIENVGKPIGVIVDTLILTRDSLIYRQVDNTVRVEVPRPLTWWQQTQIRGFWMLIGLLIIVCRKSIAGIAKWLIQKIG